MIKIQRTQIYFWVNFDFNKKLLQIILWKSIHC